MHPSTVIRNENFTRNQLQPQSNGFPHLVQSLQIRVLDQQIMQDLTASSRKGEENLTLKQYRALKELLAIEHESRQVETKEEDHDDEEVTDVVETSDVIVIKRSVFENLKANLILVEKSHQKTLHELSNARRSNEMLHEFQRIDTMRMKLQKFTRIWRFTVVRKKALAFGSMKMNLLTARKESLKLARRSNFGKKASKLSVEDLEAVLRLREENERLRLELAERARAAESLCKRLLRVDPSLKVPPKPPSGNSTHAGR